MSTTFVTKPGVDRFETGGPNGLITVVAGEPYTTDDDTEAAVLREMGSHAVELAARRPKGEQA